MADREKKGNAFTNNPIVKAIGTQKIVVVLVIIFLAIMFSVGSPAFRQYSTLVSIFDYSYYISFMAIGVTFCLITGGVDLSIGTGMICYALFGGHLITKVGMPVVVGMLAAIALGVLIGLLNALLVAVMDLPPFIATLGTMMITRGLGSLLTGAMSVTWPPAAAENGWFRSIFKLKMNGKMIPVGFILVLICVILMSIFLNKTRAGRYIIAIGSNKEATRLSGVNVVKYQSLAYLISGFFAGLAGIAYAATFQAIPPGTRSRTGAGCYRRSDHRWNIHEWWSRDSYRNSVRCFRNVTAENRFSVHRTAGKLAADLYRSGTGSGNLHRCTEK